MQPIRTLSLTLSQGAAVSYTHLEHLGLTVDFPAGQTCCGQPAFNGGYRRQARRVALQFLRTFEAAEVIVAPSGSCVAMVRHEFPHLFADDPRWAATARRLADITWELTEFIIDGLGIAEDVYKRQGSR